LILVDVLNILNLAQPGSCVCDGSGFGLSSSTLTTANGSPGVGSGEPFNVQFALKFIW